MSAWLEFLDVIQGSMRDLSLYYTNGITLKYLRMSTGAMSCRAIARQPHTGYEGLLWTVYETAPYSDTLTLVTEDGRWIGISVDAAIAVLMAEDGCYDADPTVYKELEEAYEETQRC